LLKRVHIDGIDEVHRNLYRGLDHHVSVCLIDRPKVLPEISAAEHVMVPNAEDRQNRYLN
jgi:hypothetical protein